MVSALPTAQAITRGTRKEGTLFEVVQRHFHETDFHKKPKQTTTITKISMYKDTLQHSPGVIHQRKSSYLIAIRNYQKCCGC